MPRPDKTHSLVLSLPIPDMAPTCSLSPGHFQATLCHSQSLLAPAVCGEMVLLGFSREQGSSPYSKRGKAVPGRGGKVLSECHLSHVCSCASETVGEFRPYT